MTFYHVTVKKNKSANQ